MEDYEQMPMFFTHDENSGVRKGPWSEEEDSILVNNVAVHGERNWNNIARSSGLQRTGKSCRLRWLNYLHPDVRRGNITMEEQYLILKLHCVLGNRWSKIAKYLPGRSDNEIKNYWRTRVQKQAKQLGCEVDSKLFKETMENVWMPRLLEQIQAQSSAPTCQSGESAINEPIESCLDQFIYSSDQFTVSNISAASLNSSETHNFTSSEPGQESMSGFDPTQSGFNEWSDWSSVRDVPESLWSDDSFWSQNQFFDETSYYYNH